MQTDIIVKWLGLSTMAPCTGVNLERKRVTLKFESEVKVIAKIILRNGIA